MLQDVWGDKTQKNFCKEEYNSPAVCMCVVSTHLTAASTRHQITSLLWGCRRGFGFKADAMVQPIFEVIGVKRGHQTTGKTQWSTKPVEEKKEHKTAVRFSLGRKLSAIFSFFFTANLIREEKKN